MMPQKRHHKEVKAGAFWRRQHTTEFQSQLHAADRLGNLSCFSMFGKSMSGNEESLVQGRPDPGQRRRPRELHTQSGNNTHSLASKLTSALRLLAFKHIKLKIWHKELLKEYRSNHHKGAFKIKDTDVKLENTWGIYSYWEVLQKKKNPLTLSLYYWSLEHQHVTQNNAPGKNLAFSCHDFYEVRYCQLYFHLQKRQREVILGLV